MNIESITNNREQIVASIKKAANSNEINFDYLLTQAKVESALNPDAKAKTSSATGLFQFTSSTWLAVVRRHGDAVGLSAEAAALNSNNVSDAYVSKVLDLRKEPTISAELAARFALDNAKALNAAGNKSVGSTELYLAHFLGAGGATTFLKGLRDSPERAAAASLPQAANANTGIFYAGGKPRSYREIYDTFAKKFENAAGTTPSSLALTTPELKALALSLPDKRISEIAAKAITDARTAESNVSSLFQFSPERAVVPTQQGTSSPTASDTPSLSAAEVDQIPQEALTQYLKGFSLIEQGSGLEYSEGHSARDASRGADSNNKTMDQSGDLTPLSQGAKLVLKATETKDETV